MRVRRGVLLGCDVAGLFRWLVLVSTAVPSVLALLGTVKYHWSMSSIDAVQQKQLDPGSDHRQRLLRAMAHCVGDKGYGTTTIADLVAAAAVSKRTFYEHFKTKADCLIALYELVSLQGLSILAERIDPQLPWREQLPDALNAYFDWMASDPALMRTLFVDILGLGDQGLRARRSVNEQLARFIVQRVHGADKAASRAARDYAMALVGGIHELVLEKSESQSFDRMTDLAERCAGLVYKVFPE